MSTSRKKLSSIMAAALGMSISIASATAVAQDKDTDNKTIVTFSGGGYHALSGAASWMMGMMARNPDSDGNPASLADVTTNVEAFGSNSGGSWFMSLSAYSPTFLADLEAGAVDPATFTSSGGYMGLAWERLKNNHACKGFTIPKCIAYRETMAKFGQLGLANLVLSGNGQWQDSINRDVFGAPIELDGKPNVLPYWADIKDKTLSSKPQSWLGTRDWVLAGTFLTDSPSLTYTTKDKKKGMQDILSLQGKITSAFDFRPIPGGVPVMMTSASGVDFLPTGDLTLEYGLYEDRTFFPYQEETALIENTAMASIVKKLPVIHAAGISSAAGGGFIDIPDLANTIKVDTRKVATELNGMAPGYQMDDGSGNAMMKFIDDVHDTFYTKGMEPGVLSEKLKQHKIVRMADGGFMDNTASVQMLRYLQEKNKGTLPESFNLVTFDDFPLDQTLWSNEQQTPMPTGNDVASLFGFTGCTGKKDKKECTIREKNQLTHESKLIVFKFEGITPQVFPCDQYFTKGTPDDDQTCAGVPDTSKLFWSPDDSEKISCDGVEQPLMYSKYEVSVDPSLPGSRLWGLKTSDKGSKGTLHVFSILGQKAAVVPGNDAGMTCYSTMVKQIVENVKAKGTGCDVSKTKAEGSKCTLGDYLEAALKSS